MNSHFGSKQDLLDLVQACHQKGILVMESVVANHVGPVGTDYSQVDPFNQAVHYHEKCEIKDLDYCGGNQTNLEKCRLSGLPDLDQNVPFVRDQLLYWIKNLITTFNFDGIRIDTVPQAAAGVYSVGEVFCYQADYCKKYQGPLDSVLNYPIFFTLRNVFISGQSAKQISSTQRWIAQNFPDADALGLFIDNHDNTRFLYENKDRNRYKAALAYVLFGQGIPIIYYGTEQGFAGGQDPQCREPLWTSFNKQSDLYKWIAQVNGFRKNYAIHSSAHLERFVDDSVYTWSRGQVFIAITNSKNAQEHRDISSHPYLEGQTVCNLFWGTQDCVKITNGKLGVYLNNGETKIYAPKPAEIDVN